MFFHVKELQYPAKPERPDPVYAKKLQEVLGGAFGEITVMMQYLFQGWNCRGPAKYRDLLLDVGTEEMAHVEMLADFRSNLAAESQGRLQVARLYEMTTDPGVRDMLAFLLARDTYHQRMWAAAIEELEAEGWEATPVPAGFPQQLERADNNHQLWNFSQGDESSRGRWAQIEIDGRPIEYVQEPVAMGDAPELGIGHPKLYNTARDKALAGVPNGR